MVRSVASFLRNEVVARQPGLFEIWFVRFVPVRVSGVFALPATAAKGATAHIPRGDGVSSAQSLLEFLKHAVDKVRARRKEVKAKTTGAIRDHRRALTEVSTRQDMQTSGAVPPPIERNE